MKATALPLQRLQVQGKCCTRADTPWWWVEGMEGGGKTAAPKHRASSRLSQGATCPAPQPADHHRDHMPPSLHGPWIRGHMPQEPTTRAPCHGYKVGHPLRLRSSSTTNRKHKHKCRNTPSAKTSRLCLLTLPRQRHLGCNWT